MSAKKDLFIALQNRLKDKVATLQHIDKLFGQLNNLGEHVIPYPAVLIEFARWEITTQGKNEQRGILFIRFHCLFENYSYSFEGSEDQSLALLYFDFVESIHKALQGFSGPTFTSLQRTGEEEDVDHQVVIDTVLEYATELTDISGARDADNVETENELTPRAIYVRPLSASSPNIVSDFEV